MAAWSRPASPTVRRSALRSSSISMRSFRATVRRCSTSPFPTIASAFSKPRARRRRSPSSSRSRRISPTRTSARSSRRRSRPVCASSTTATRVASTSRACLRASVGSQGPRFFRRRSRTCAGRARDSAIRSSSSPRGESTRPTRRAPATISTWSVLPCVRMGGPAPSCAPATVAGRSSALATANWPTGPQPKTATVSPSVISARSAPK